MAQWFIVRGSRQHGPVDDAKLRKLAASGKLLPDDIVRREDMSSGRKAKDIEGLLPLSADDLTAGNPSATSPAAAATSSTPSAMTPPQGATAASSMPKSSWWQSPWFLVASCVFCFPIAYVALWTNSAWSRSRKIRWSLGLAALIAVLVSMKVSKTQHGTSHPPAESTSTAEQKKIDSRPRTPGSTSLFGGPLHPNRSMTQVLSRLPKRLSAMPVKDYAALLEAMEMRNPEAIASAVRHCDPYKLFDEIELAAMKQPIKGYAVYAGHYQLEAGEEARKYDLPTPLAFVSVVDDADVKKNSSLVVSNVWGSFYLTKAAKENAIDELTTEYKSIHLDPDDGKHFVIEEVRFLQKDKVTHIVKCYNNRISSILCQQLEHHGTHDSRSAASSNQMYKAIWGRDLHRRAGDSVTSYRKFYEIRFAEDGTPTIDRDP